MRSAFLVAVSVLWVACAGEGANDSRPVVAVSVPPQAWVVEGLAGDLVRVRVMVPPGAEAHSFEPTLKDLGALSEAALYVKVGHPHFTFEQAGLGEVLGDRPNLRIVNSTEGVASDADDPHVWLAPSQVRPMARNIAAALAELLPERREAINAQLSALEAEIEAVDGDIRRLFAPKQGRRFFVFHPAWSYFARDYGLVQVAIERDGREPDPNTLADVISDARKAGVKTIFVHPQQSSAGARLVAEEIGAQVETIDPMAYDWSTNLKEVARKIAQGLVE